MSRFPTASNPQQATPQFERVDINSLNQQVRDQARQNIIASQALEAEFDPVAAQLRSAAQQEMLAAMGLTDSTFYNPILPPVSDFRGLLANRETAGDVNLVRQNLLRDLGMEFDDISMPEISDPAMLERVREMIMSDLMMGGQLDRETQNMVARRAGMTSGAAGTLGSRSARDLTARDLGLTSMQLRDQRMGRAADMGLQDRAANERQQSLADSINKFNASQRIQGAQLNIQRGGLLTDIDSRQTGMLFDAEARDQASRAAAAAAGTADQNRRLSLAGAFFDRPGPMAGLDPEAIANLTLADMNAMNQFNQQQQAIAAQEANARTQSRSNLGGAAIGGLATLGAAGKLGGAVSAIGAFI
jgi:hypothetical protein